MLNLNYKSYGQGDPVIILHGLFGMLDNWQTIAKVLAEKYTVFVIDLRNHGKSPHTDEFDYQILAEDLKDFMESNWIYKAKLIGHSMGGKAVMQFANNYPDMIEKMVIVDIGPQGYEGGHDTIFKALFELDPKNLSSRKEAEDKLEIYIKDVGIRQFLLKNLTRDLEGGYRLKMNLQSLSDNYKAIIGPVEIDESISTPTLFIKGGLSNYITEEDIPLINNQFSNCEIKTIEDTGHWVHAQAPKLLIKMVDAFFE